MVFAVVLLGLAGAGSASAYIYIGNGQTIARANNDGTGLTPNFIDVDGFACGVAVDSTHIYWADFDSIGRANLDGTGVQQDFVDFPGSANVCGIDVSGTHVYWADRAGQRIGRVPLSGASPAFDFVTLSSSPCGVAVDENYVYYGADNDGQVPGRSALPLGGSPTGFPGPTQAAACAVATTGNRFYYSNYYAPGPGLPEIKLVSGGLEFSIGVSAKKPCGIAATSSTLLWTNYVNPDGGSSGSVGRAALDTSGAASAPPNQSFITGLSEPCGIAVDDLPALPDPPAVDSDGDGVPDASDRCPSESGPASNQGCPSETPDGSACDKAKKKLKQAKQKLKKLRGQDAPAQKLKSAKQKVKRAKQRVKKTCG